MTKLIAIDPGNYKCGIILADLEEKKIYEALVLEINEILLYVKNLLDKENNIKIIMGNGTSYKNCMRILSELKVEIVPAEERNTTFRAKQRFFNIFPPKGLKRLLPREIFIMNKNLDALAALLILEDYYKVIFEFAVLPNPRIWKK